MNYDDIIPDLRDAGLAAGKALREKSLRHIVYAYIEKNNPGNIYLLDRNMLEFKTDEQFDRYLKQAHGEVETLYAVHNL